MENDTRLRTIKPLLKTRKTDDVCKTALSFGVTVVFALYNGFLGVHLRSIWHGGICVFYLLLAAIRGMILLTEKSNKAREEKQQSKCRQRTFAVSAVLLLLLNVSLILPISLMVVMEKPVHMGLIPAISMAVYTTYKITVASIRVRRQRHGDQILMAELRTINLIDALVSVLSLQNTLIMVNQTKPGVHDMLVLSAVSSAVIYLGILLITVSLLVKGFRRT